MALHWHNWSIQSTGSRGSDSKQQQNCFHCCYDFDKKTLRLLLVRPNACKSEHLYLHGDAVCLLSELMRPHMPCIGSIHLQQSHSQAMIINFYSWGTITLYGRLPYIFFIFFHRVANIVNTLPYKNNMELGLRVLPCHVIFICWTCPSYKFDMVCVCVALHNQKNKQTNIHTYRNT